MLYIEKKQCPADIADNIEQVKRDFDWENIPDPANCALSSAERTAAVKKLRECFNHLDKGAIRQALLSEQHYLCAYCMLPLQGEGLHTTIEHWAPLSKGKENALEYSNFLATCKGGSDISGLTHSQRVICCDAQKNDEDSLILDPRNEDMMQGIIYHRDGIIDYSDEAPFNVDQIKKDIFTTLRLNGELDKDNFCKRDTSTKLVQGRRDVYQNTEQICLDALDRGSLSIEWIQTRIQNCLNQEHREKFAGVAIFVYSLYLDKLQSKGP